MTNLRPMRYNEGTGWIYVTLTDADLARAYTCGVSRWKVQRKGKNHDAAFRPGQGPRNDIEGAVAEIAFWYLCGKTPPEDMVLSLPEWERERGPHGGKLTDVLGTELRATTHPDGQLFIHKHGSRDGDEKKDTIFVLSIVDVMPYYKSGFTTGDVRIDRLIENDKLPQYRREVRFVGWCYGHEVRDEHWFEDCPKPDFAVPQRDLHPMGDLAPKLFPMPETDADVFDQLFNVG